MRRASSACLPEHGRHDATKPWRVRRSAARWASGGRLAGRSVPKHLAVPRPSVAGRCLRGSCRGRTLAPTRYEPRPGGVLFGRRGRPRRPGVRRLGPLSAQAGRTCERTRIGPCTWGIGSSRRRRGVVPRSRADRALRRSATPWQGAIPCPPAPLEGSLAQRKPLLVLRFDGWLPLRFAQRRLAGGLTQEPPRSTRTALRWSNQESVQSHMPPAASAMP